MSLDDGSTDPDRPAPRAAGRYVETLRVPLRWWAVATMFLASVLLAFLVAMPAVYAVLLALVLVALTVGVFLGYGRAQLRVEDGIFTAGRASIPVRWLADPEPLDDTATRRAIGVEADVRAYLLVRPYLRRSVRVRVTDPGDTTPYWLVGTRRPRTLAAELAAAIGANTASSSPG